MIVVVGLSHRTAPISIREKIAFDTERMREFVCGLIGRAGISEVLVLSTCNRVEVVAAGAELGEVARGCAAALCDGVPSLNSHLYTHQAGAAVRHLFRVAASLDSLVLGEPQILGQLKDAYAFANRAGTVGSVLHRVVPRAIRAAKRVRSQTSVGTGQTSVPNVAVDLTRQIFGELRGLPVLLVGSGEMAELLAKLLRALGAQIIVLGRNRERVSELASAVGGQARLWAGLGASLVEASVVITSTRAPGFVIDYEMVREARRSRRGKNQFFIDLAVPRDVDPRVEQLQDVFLYNVDDLSRVVEESLSSRSKEAELAEQIIASEVRGYDRWSDAAQATPTIVALRGRLRSAMEAELRRSLRGKLKHLHAGDRAALNKMLDAAVNRVLHAPSVRLREAALGTGASSLSLEQLSAALGELFGLEEDGELEAESEREVSSIITPRSIGDLPQ